MATRYKRQKDGRFQTKVWDGTYDKYNMKHYITLYSDKSSKDLENKVSNFIKNRESGNIKVSSDILFIMRGNGCVPTKKCGNAEPRSCMKT